MTSRPRTRIARLAQSLGQSPVKKACPPHRRTAPGHTSLTRAFDEGEPVGLYADDPTYTNDVDPTQPQHVFTAAPRTSPAPKPVATSPAVLQPPSTETPTTAAPLAEAPTAAAPLAEAPAKQPSSDDAHLEASGWTVPQATETNDQAFAEDIQAILAHAQSASSSSRVPLPDVPSAPSVPAPPAVANGVGAGASQDIFDNIVAANAPSRFDQGPVALSVDFDRLDRALGDVTTPALVSVAPGHESVAPGAGAAAAPETGTAGAPTSANAREPAQPATEPAPVAPTLPTPADASAPTAAGKPFRVVTDVPLLPQGPGLSCHAAACASLVAWRDEVPPDSAAVAAATGYWERFADGRTATYPDVLETFGLTNASIGRPPTPAALRDLLDNNGPLFIAASPPGEHAVVVAAITGDGTENGTVVDVVDPWAKGMTTYSAPNPGSHYSVPYSALLESVGGGPEHEIVVAHLRKGSS